MTVKNRRDLARSYFQKLGLSYQDIGTREIARLITFLTEELELHAQLPDALHMFVAPTKSFSKQRILLNPDYSLKMCDIRVKSYYFDNRQAITFERDGFIGFAGELSSKNERPILRAFYRWMRWLRFYKNIENFYQGQGQLIYAYERLIAKRNGELDELRVGVRWAKLFLEGLISGAKNSNCGLALVPVTTIKEMRLFNCLSDIKKVLKGLKL